MFFDHVRIEVRSGQGGDGAITFRREKYVPDGGPDGGDGGKGGDVYFEASAAKNTLIDYRFKHNFSAGDGMPGRKRKQFGKGGDDLCLVVPCGTLLYDDETGKLLADLRDDGQKVLLLKGGKGGIGNVHFKNSVRQAPNFARAGGLPESLSLRLELRLIADIGLVGQPNAGKSSLLSTLTRADAKVADYAFTTVEPQLGVLASFGTSLVLADLPGLIEGAAEGAGLGHEFLRHTARCKLLIHVVDAAQDDPLAAYDLIQAELKGYGQGLDTRPQILVLNKADLLSPERRRELLESFEARGLMPSFLSTASFEGIESLKERLFALLPKLEDPSAKHEVVEDWRLYKYVDEAPFRVKRMFDHVLVEGEWLTGLIRSTNFEDPESFHYFQRQIKRKGLNEALEAAGVKEGEWVRIGDSEFQYVP